jgi:hypothetical protein
VINHNFNLTAAINAYESGASSIEDDLVMFQHLVDTAKILDLQGDYLRRAEFLIEAGMIYPPKNYEFYPQRSSVTA